MSALRARLQALWARVQGWYGGHSRRDQRIILGVLALAAVSVLYLWGWVPLREYRQGVGDEIAEGQQQLARSVRILGSADSLRAERESLEKRLKQARGRLLPGRGATLGAAALQERTNSLAAEKGITVQSTQVMKEENIDPYRKVSVRLTLSGELKPFAELLSGLEYGQQLAIPFVEANRRGAVPGAKGPRTISSTVEVTGFVLGEGAKGDEGAPPEGVETADAGAAEGSTTTTVPPGEGTPATAAPEGATGAAPAAATGGAPVAAAGGPTGEVAGGPTGAAAASTTSAPAVSTTTSPVPAAPAAKVPGTTTTSTTKAPAAPPPAHGAKRPASQAKPGSA